ncbi:hypothetical protein [Pseudomonas sp. UFMG81]|uniref:hypothetical protein n=1 Tax=Pseudomonas sp. UFMG81 TaxID=2745936 RepID=UPI00188EAAC6|nr:hypothetical protein [Pseudomonas sp. UFMG81]
MLISANGLSWQAPIQSYNRIASDQSLAPLAAFEPVAAPGNSTAQQGSQGSTSQQNTEDNRKEAFAKLMVMLQNPDVAARQQASIGEQKETDAAQAFRDYMAKSPEEKIKEKILQELGLTEDEYNALPPERKAIVDQQIAQRMKEDVEMKTQAKLEQQAQRTQAASQLGAHLGTGDAQAEDKRKTIEL